MNKNDKKILDLKSKIDSQEAELKESVKFAPKTKLILDGFNFNTINANNLQTATNFLVDCNLKRISAEDLSVDYIVDGYNINEWIHDLKGKILEVGRKKKLSDLKNMKAKLDKLLSDDKKVELDIDNIENMLKNI